MFAAGVTVLWEKGLGKGGGCACLLLGEERVVQACLSSGAQMGGGGERRQGKVVLPAPERWAAPRFWAGCCFRYSAKALELVEVS